MARHQPKPLKKGLPVDLDDFRSPRLRKAPDVDPVLIQPATSRLAVVPDVESADEAEVGTRATDGEGRNSGVSETLETGLETEASPGPEGGNAAAPGSVPAMEAPAPAPAPQDATVETDTGHTSAAESQSPEARDVGGGVEQQTPPRPTGTANARPTKITIGLQPAEAARVRAAYMNLPAKMRPRSLSAFAAVPLMEYVRQIEEQYNGGQPFEPIEAGEIPTGRPLGS